MYKEKKKVVIGRKYFTLNNCSRTQLVPLYLVNVQLKYIPDSLFNSKPIK